MTSPQLLDENALRASKPDTSHENFDLTEEKERQDVATEPIETAITALYKEDDTIEVRAWDKHGNVYTGRYRASKELIEDIRRLNESCDVYCVLNPVGNKYGLREFGLSGLGTSEPDIPWRRYFLLDFDPKRDNKIANQIQWAVAYDAARRAKEWLESFGFKGIILASSGNGCHLVVPCELPNDSQSKGIVRKVQRIVASKFSTPEVECECFPDANRLIRAYGTVNRKGSETETLKYRRSGIMVPRLSTDDDPKNILLRIISENPLLEVVTREHGEGKGPFSRELLYERLGAWANNWRDQNGESFRFEKTERLDGFRVLCPGNMRQGWADGEQHGDISESLNDSSIVYVENGWPRFSCRHHHCGEGAAHGKKTWRDLQDFYDPGKQFHCILDEPGCPSDEFPRPSDDDVNDERVARIQVPRDVQQTAVDKSGTDSGAPRTPPRDLGPNRSAQSTLSEMPESCMYGWLGKAARELETPLGFAYPAVLTVYAAQISSYPRHVRPTLYTCLMGPVHCGKSETIKRAIEYIRLSSPETVKKTVPGSDRGLINIFKPKRNKDENTATSPAVKARLLAQDELRNTLAKANISGSSLPATLCTLWSEDEAGAADKTGEHVSMVQLSILGALKADDAEEFAETFGRDSTAGLYDRFIYGLAPSGWKYKPWDREPVERIPTGCKITGKIFDMLEAWRDKDPENRGRLGEIALRIAYITSAANQDSEVTEDSMRCALEFIQWQEQVRAAYRPGMADTLDAQCTNAILNVLDSAEPGAWIRWKEISSKKNWYRKFGSITLSRVREALEKTGITDEEKIGNKRTGRLRRRSDSDDH